MLPSNYFEDPIGIRNISKHWDYVKIKFIRNAYLFSTAEIRASKLYWREKQAGEEMKWVGTMQEFIVELKCYNSTNAP
jgi:hypothetical protein